jgi:predicted MPP superfamily phosphohydrolase
VDDPLHPTERVLVLSHTPDNIYALRGRAKVVFSGHTHGGQWRIPGVGALVVPSKFGRRFDRGHFSVDGTELFVSAGLGADFPPVRVYCQPELLVVDLESVNAVESIAQRQIAVKL